MYFPQDFNVRVAAKGYNDFPMQKYHTTTMDFGYIKPVEMKYCIPGDKIHVDLSHITKVLTMPSPTFGRAKMVLRAFYVPLNDVWRDFNDFISNKLVPNSAQTSVAVEVPKVCVSDIWRVLLRHSSVVDVPSNNPYDIRLRILTLVDGSYSSSDETDTYYKFDYFGKRLYDFIVSLGLKLPPFKVDYLRNNTEQDLYPNRSRISSFVERFRDEDDTSKWTIYQYASYEVSVLPFLSFWKFYLDWIVPSRFLGNYTNLRYVIERRDLSQLTYTDFMYLFSQVPISYLQDDFFTTAFSTAYGYENDQAVPTILPNLGKIGLEDDDRIFDASVSAAKRNYGAAVATENHESGESIDFTAINMFSLRSLGALQDMVNRGKISGNKVRDYLEVTYGVRPSDDALHISTYIGRQVNDIIFGDIQNKVDTYNPQTGDGSLIGQYVGAANVNGDHFVFDFDVKDKMNGYLFITAELDVETSYVQGLMPEFRQISHLDFIDPAFDGVGVSALPSSLLMSFSPFVDVPLDIPAFHSPDDIFGFIQQYAQYKVNFDNISGDYLFRSLNTGMDSWILSRLFSFTNYWRNYPMINERFVQAHSEDTNEGFDRIFSVDNPSIDHFRITFDVGLKMSRRLKSVRDTLEFEDGGKNISKSVNGGVQN